MGRRIVWSKEARDLFKGILTYWENRNGSKKYSLKLSKLLQDDIQQISTFPETGRLTDNKKVRYRIVRDYHIYYTYTNTEIEIISICDMRRDPKYIKSLLK